MHRSWFRPFLALTAIVAALAVPAATTAQLPPLVKTPTAVGTGGAAATVDVLATEAAVDALRAGANAVDAAVVAAAVLGVTEPFSCGIGGGGFMVIRTADGDVTTIDGRETAPAAMRPTRSGRAGRRFRSTTPVTAGSPPACPEPSRSLGRGARRYGTMKLARGVAAGDRGGSDGLRRRPDVLRPDAGERRLLRRHPLDRGDLPRPGRHSARRRHRAPQPGPGSGVRADRPPRRQGLLPRRDRRRDGRGGPGPADRAPTRTTSGAPA